MEKRGEIFNQLAIIADLLENINLESESKSVVLILSNDDFEKLFKKIIKKAKTQSDMNETTFSLKIGDIDFIFNKSNV
jgi:hypothetical protein